MKNFSLMKRFLKKNLQNQDFFFSKSRFSVRLDKLIVVFISFQCVFTLDFAETYEKFPSSLLDVA